jgi:uncharacterized protein (DUF2141 family)
MNTIFLFYLGLFFGNYQTTETVDLQIVVTNIHSIKGNIELGIFKDSKTFLEIGKEYKTYSKKVINDSLIFTLNGVAKGNYAISVYHDKNSDKKCNLNFLGIPVESYGFSQNYKPTIRKPTFEECKITANKNMSIPIKLID